MGWQDDEVVTVEPGGVATSGAMPPDYGSMSAGDVGLSAAKNLWPSAKKFGSDMVQPVLHPIDTAKSLGSLGMGLIEKLIPGEQGHEASADAVGKFFMDRYGSIEGIKKTLATDPVGAAADLATVLTGAGGLAARAPGMAGKAGRVASTAGRAIDPLALAVKTGKLGGSAVATAIGNLGTHTGGDSIRSAFGAGVSGGQKGADFLDNMRGNVPIANVVEDAKSAVRNLRENRSQSYQSGMAEVGKVRDVIDFLPIDDAMTKIRNVGRFKGQITKPSTAGIWDDINEAVTKWKQLDPADYHTPEGMDALKQIIGDLRDNTQFGTSSRVVADQAYRAVWDEIVKQAPEYAKVMKGYEQASDLITDIEKTLSINNKASVDTTLRKLQSVMRNNVNTNYGRRADLLSELDAVGSGNLTEKIAGQSLNTLTPRGLGAGIAAGNLGAAMYYTDPAMAALLIPQSPRLMGEAAYHTGLAGRLVVALSSKVGPKRAQEITMGMFQGGRAADELEGVEQ
jgi:hypothetical protein